MARAAWDRLDPKPATPFVAVRKIAARLLAAGHDPDAIVEAMVAVPTISVGWVEAELRKRTPASRTRPAADRAAPSGRLEAL